MAEEPRLRRYAVLIDADNVDADIANGLFVEIARFGEATVRRIYGNFVEPHLKGWVAVLARHAIEPVQVFAPVKGKNASDIALVIDAMDLLHGGRVDGFCLVSSDSDFTRLAIRLRASGAAVIGCGWSKTPKSFRRACTRFIAAEKLLPDAPARPPVAEPPKVPPPTLAAPKTEQRKEAPAKAKASKPVRTNVTPARHPPSKAAPLLTKALKQFRKEGVQAGLDALEARCRELDETFKIEAYNVADFQQLVKKAGPFEILSGLVQVRANLATSPKAKGATT